MSDHEFIFALDLSDELHFDSMLSDLTGTLLAYVGFTPAAAAELRTALRTALTDGRSNGRQRCDVKFQARSGQLLITVAYDGGAEWRTTRALP